MEPYAAAITTAIVAIALLGLAIVSFAAWNRREVQRKNAIGSSLDDSVGTKQLHPDRSGRWMAIGFIIFALAIGLLIGVLSSYLARFFPG